MSQRSKSSLCSIILLCILGLFVASCAKDIVDINGSIHGVVKDYNTGALLSNCQVSLSPSGKSALTGSDGLFEFSDLEQGSYTISISKAGYEEVSKTVSVVSGETTEVNIVLKAKSAFAASSNKLDFGDLSSSMELYFFNNSDESCTFTISNIPSWASFSHASGSVAAGGNTALSVSVNREAVNYGTYTQIVNVAYKGKTSGNINITIQMQKVQLTAPTVNIADAAENITQNEFTIGGELTATGGAEVSSYGHCWALTPNPTIDNYKTDNGATTSVGSFKSAITGLTPGTSYYVRAYATNQYGTSYSSQLVVTTQDVASNKWDGNIATSFARGSGTSVDPYIIETGGQLLLMKDYNDKYFELANNIDLDNKNWMPFEFKGTLDGKGCIISNLYVNRSTDNQGLFSELNRGTVMNLTIKNVNIVAVSNSNIGCLAGTMSNKAKITKCNVILNENSQISGNENVGGMVGIGGGRYSSSGDCGSIVESAIDYSGTATDIIKGNKNVGGIVGELYCTSSEIKSCKVSANIKGSSNIGGIVGYYSSSNQNYNIKMYSCCYTGTLIGEECVGGIIGYSEYCSVFGSKANVNLTASTGLGGGIIGDSKSSSSRPDLIVACYATGSIDGSSSATSYGGLLGSHEYYDTGAIIMSYSTVVSSLANYDGLLGKGRHPSKETDCKFCASTSPTRYEGTNQGSCKDITTFLKECYQTEYDSYWNYQKTWTWSGKIGGAQVKVSCPTLSWE